MPSRYHLRLLFEFSRRDVLSRYSGSQLGVLWSIVTPMLMLIVYTYVFSEVFKARWGSNEESKMVFALNVYCGMIVHGFFAEVLGRSTNAILGNANYVKKVRFPLGLLPVVGVVSALFFALTGLAILILAIVIYGQGLTANAFFLPLVWLPLLVWCLAIAYLLSATTVYFRDIAQMTMFVSTVTMFLSPVFFSAKSLAKEFQAILELNPLTLMIENTRAVLLLDKAPDWAEWASSLGIAFIALFIGRFIFTRLRPGFADVL
jgi:lipopolysaccharide transport system permease protein